jgi:hypothetical protein
MHLVINCLPKNRKCRNLPYNFYLEPFPAFPNRSRFRSHRENNEVCFEWGVLVTESGTENLSTEKAVEITMFEKKRMTVNNSAMLLLLCNILVVLQLIKLINKNGPNDHKLDLIIDSNYSDLFRSKSMQKCSDRRECFNWVACCNLLSWAYESSRYWNCSTGNN